MQGACAPLLSRNSIPSRLGGSYLKSKDVHGLGVLRICWTDGDCGGGDHSLARKSGTKMKNRHAAVFLFQCRECPPLTAAGTV